MKITRANARAFALTKQCFGHLRTCADRNIILKVLVQLGCVQIDSINVIERSHYLAFWSRLGNYRKEWLDYLLSRDRMVFEYWAHAASMIPIQYYRYFIPAMKARRKALKERAQKWLKNDAGLIDVVLERIKRDGPLSSKDFKSEHKEKSQSGWWNWKPAKYALELLYDAGILMVSRRENFQRYYDLTENVLPSNVNTDEPTTEEQQRFFLTKTLDAWGLAQLKEISQYFYTWSTKTALGIKALSNTAEKMKNEDIITTVEVEDAPNPYLMLTKDARNLTEITDENDQPSGVTLISPFDNLIWSRSRTKSLFGFQPTLEIYVPKEDRKFGYYTLNILFDSQIVGRLDPKIHRDKAELEVKALELRSDFKATQKFTDELILTLEDFMAFHCAEVCQFSGNCPEFLKRIDFSSLSANTRKPR